ncbi:MAG: hypothetical protein N2C14_30205, partial [Planctomycetales bacterium]
MSLESSSSLPALLPKGQVKSFELTFFTPRLLHESQYISTQADEFVDDTRRAVKFSVGLTPRGGNRAIIPGRSFPLRTMLDHQFYFFVLATEPARYSNLQKLPSFRSRFELPESMGSNDPDALCYHIIRPKLKTTSPIPLSSNPLTWTNIAYVLWDGVAVDRLTAEQQEAMVDWLHWGGQLIVNGPSSLDKLHAKNSFLRDYMPAEALGDEPLTEDDLRPLSERWTQEPRDETPDADGNRKAWGIQVLKPWPCRKVALHPESKVVVRAGDDETGQPMIVERRVGQGRIILSTFPLTQPEFKFWLEGDDAFFNACVMRREQRKFHALGPESDTMVFDWTPENANTTFQDARRTLQDARRTPEDTSTTSEEEKKRIPCQTPRQLSQVRYFTRDEGARSGSPDWMGQAGTDTAEADYDPYGQAGYWDEGFAMARLSKGPSVAAWDDYNAAGDAAFEALKEAAGIKAPDRAFIIQVIAVYLVVLVPLNWLVFRAIGKVEWA